MPPARKRRRFVEKRMKVAAGDRLVVEAGKGQISMRLPRHIVVNRERPKRD